MMLDYARQHAITALSQPGRVILVTSGPAGVQAGEFPCEAKDLVLYLLMPRTSDHLFNLEHNPTVSLLSAGWELKGEATLLVASSVAASTSMPADGAPAFDLVLLKDPAAPWCVLLRIDPVCIQIKREGGWGNIETIDLNPQQ
jgi:hypothetical protein